MGHSNNKCQNTTDSGTTNKVCWWQVFKLFEDHHVGSYSSHRVKHVRVFKVDSLATDVDVPCVLTTGGLYLNWLIRFRSFSSYGSRKLGCMPMRPVVRVCHPGMQQSGDAI